MGRLTLLLALVACLGFAGGCTSSDDDDDGAVAASSLSGTIRDANGAGIQGVVVRVQAPGAGGASAEAVTDVDGNFIVLAPPTGLVNLHLDAMNASGGFGAIYPDLEVPIFVGGGANNLAQPVVLPDLATGATQAVAVDANGMTMGPTTLTAPNGAALDVADMTEILLDGAIPAMPVDLNITPVDPINVPMPLPGSLDAGAFVTVQPENATFDPGLGITLPNSRNFPVGTMVDIWSFDHDEAAWVNRSLETGNQGVVEPTGMFIVAMGVITEGGWHSGALPVEPACATTITGQVFTLGSPTPIDDVVISLSTGQFAQTGADGRFSIASVPAYDASMLPTTCVGADITLRAQAPVSFGAGFVTMTIAANTIVTGGTTNVPAFDILVSNTGSLVGSATENGQRVAGTVSITGPQTLDVLSDANGSFFVASLAPGNYMAAFPFASGGVMEDFTIVAHQTTVLSLTAGPPPSGGGALEVHVLDFIDNDVGIAVPDACVTLQGTGGAPQFATSDVNGIASFPNAPSGPYNVTAQKDSASIFGTNRLAVSVLGVDSASTPKVIVLPFLDNALLVDPVVTDATLEGTISNEPLGAVIDFEVDNDLLGFEAEGAAQGGFNTGIPSDVPLDVAVTAVDQSTGAISTVLMTNVMATPGQTLMLDFDFANAVDFDQTVTMQYTNDPGFMDVFAEFELSGVGTLTFAIDDGPQMPLPPSLVLPDLSIPGLAPLDTLLSVGAEQSGMTFSEVYCDFPLGHATRTALQVDFLGLPTIQSPANNAALPSFGPGDSVQFTLGTGNGTATGFNSVSIFGEGNVFAFWDIIVPASQTTVVLPPVFATKPMFSDGFGAVNVGAVRFDFPGLDFATFFDANLPNNLAAVATMDICESDVSHFFSFGMPQPVNQPGNRGALMQRASQIRALLPHETE